MACKYKYKNKWYSESEVKSQILRDISSNDVIVELATQMNYTVEINTAKEKTVIDVVDVVEGDPFSGEKRIYSESKVPTQHYSNLTVPGGTNYTENEIATPAIVPSIKGHAAFSTDSSIGWFRSDDKISEQKKEFSDLLIKNRIEDTERINELRKTKDLPTKTRRILEVQSDLFQKGRDRKDLINEEIGITKFRDFEFQGNQYKLLKVEKEGYTGLYDSYKNDEKIDREEYNKVRDEYVKSLLKNNENQFLQLLNKDNNWITFFVKSIIQSTAKETIQEINEQDVENMVKSLQREGKLKIKCD